jgi:peptidoglycan/xylan/chitin deacetylase (PgdA/CDA1 family)
VTGLTLWGDVNSPPVLCYHRIGGPLELGVTRLGRRVFERQMRALAQGGWRTLTLAAFAERLKTAPRAREFLLTFDDGYGSLADQAYPVLADIAFTAVTFLVTDHVGGTNTWDARYTWHRLPHLPWGEVERWQARGFEFGSHTATHGRLTWLDDRRAAEELNRSRDTLVRRLGPPAGRAVAYPFGAWNDRIVRLAGAAGYELGFGGVTGYGPPLTLPRVPVYVWDRGSIPLGLRRDALGTAGRVVAHVANRCAVGTTVMLKLMGGRQG